MVYNELNYCAENPRQKKTAASSGDDKTLRRWFPETGQPSVIDKILKEQDRKRK